MKSGRWQEIQTLFHAAAEFPAARRQAYLEERCGGDAELVAEVLALLEEDARGDSLLDRGLDGAVQATLNRDPGVAIPREIDGYRIKRLLGEGGMGVVYLAERKAVGGQVAIKFLRDAWLSPARQQRFTNEQRTLVQLEHPGIARLYDAGVLADGTPWFSMEYVEGEPLAAHCEARRTGIIQRLQLFRAVCEAVLHAHRHLVVHRDLKPSNILVKEDGTVKLLDFGIAKQVVAADLPADSSRTGLRLMTLAYAAPEQIRGAGVGIHTDVYSLGVILYELLTGRLPFDLAGLTASQAEAMILEHVPVKPAVLARLAGTADARSLDRPSWGDLDVLCPRAMHKDPARRYPTVEALIRDIDHFLRGEPLEARPDEMLYRVRKFVRRNRPTLLATAMVLAAAVALVTFYTVRLAGARNAALAAAARAQRIQQFTMDLFEGGDREAGPAAGLLVSTLVDRGLIAARSLEQEPEVQADLYGTLGGIYQKLGDLERAETLLMQALEQRTALSGADSADTASSMVVLGLLRLEQARHSEAEELIRGGLDRLRRLLPDGDEAATLAAAALGQSMGARGAYDEAKAVLHEAAEQRREAASSLPDAALAAVLYELANVHFYAGNYETSESLNREVLGMYRQVHGDGHPHVADGLINLGAIQFERGEYATAEAEYRQALAITEGWFGGDHPKTAANLTMLSRALVYQQRSDEAASLLQRALAIRERVYGASHPAVASTLNELGNIAVAQDRHADAEAAFSRMLEIYLNVYPDGHYLTAVALANLGSVHMNTGDHVRAEPLLRQAISIYEGKLGAGHLNTGIARIKLGRVLLRQGRAAEAEAETLGGYQILSGQTSPSVSFLSAARHDLVAIYQALQQPDQAARFQDEIDG